MTKICKKCGIEKPLGEYYTYTVHRLVKSLGASKAYTYYKNTCAMCDNAQYTQWSAENDRTEYWRNYHNAHRENEQTYGRAYNKSPHGRDTRNRYERTRRASDPMFRLNRNMKSNLGRVLNGGKMGRHWEDLLGYTAEDLKRHLESLFRPGMNWENYGKGSSKWNVDHRIPQSWFVCDGPNSIGFKMCWELNNLQPMWEIENTRKLNRWVS